MKGSNTDVYKQGLLRAGGPIESARDAEKEDSSSYDNV